MEQEIAPPTTRSKASFSQSTTPARLRTSSRVKDSSRSEVFNGVSPGMKTRPRLVPTSPNNSQKVKRPLGLNRFNSGQDVVGSQKGREVEEVKIVGRWGNQPVVEKPRRRADPSCKRNEDGPDGKKKELQEKLNVNENLVKDLQSEILALKTQLEKVQSLNVELELQNRRFAEDLTAAEAKISSLSSRNQREPVAEFQSPKFEDVQKLIANKLELLRVKEPIKEVSTVKIQSAAPLQPVAKVAELQPKVLMNHPPPPPPPPPLPSRAPTRTAATQKAPALVHFYNSLTKIEGKKDPPGPRNHSHPVAINAHSSIVGEIQNRSAHLLAIKADVETKGEFIKSLIHKVQVAVYTDIEDVSKFIDWLDGELSSLADERAVLKHFSWPERKADAMREAAIEYRDLKQLESEVSSYKDDFTVLCESALKKIVSLLDKSERSIERLIKLRASTMLSYRECKIPTDWMLDSGMVIKIKQASMKLAQMYMKRVSLELESDRNSERESTHEALLLQGVRFAYRTHQFAGGLDSETMCAFEEIKQRVPAHVGGCRELITSS